MDKPDLSARYDRNFNTFSREDQQALKKSRVMIAGLGGLGGGVCEMLARAGVGHLKLIDHDLFETSNLNRQILCTEDLIGISKADAAVKRIQMINSEVSVVSCTEMLDESNLYQHIKNADVIIDCLDTIDMRFKLQDAAAKADIPIVSGAIAGVAGQVTTIMPGDKGYALIYGENSRKKSSGIETETGNIAYCALMVASIQASECVKILLKRGNILQNKLLVTDLWSNAFEVLSLI